MSFNEEINNLFLENNLILTFNCVESLSLVEKNKYVELIDFLKERCKVFVDCSDIKDFLRDVEEIQVPVTIENEKTEIKLDENSQTEIRRSINAKRIPAKENEANKVY